MFAIRSLGDYPHDPSDLGVRLVRDRPCCVDGAERLVVPLWTSIAARGDQYPPQSGE